LFLKKVEDLFTFEQKSLEKNEEMVSQLLFSLKHPVLLKSLIVASTETTFFIHNECSIMFEELLGLFDITAFDFWKILNAYIAIDPLMPASLKQHLRAIEVKIVQQLGWLKGSQIIDEIETLRKKGDTGDVLMKHADERIKEN
jgi:hypothetical protein